MACGNSTDIQRIFGRRLGSLSALAVLLVTLAAIPATAGDAGSGRVLAEKWCAGCHLIGRSAPGTDVAPPFTGIAADPEKSRERIEAWLATPHTAMPSLPLTRREIADLITYIESLAP